MQNITLIVNSLVYRTPQQETGPPDTDVIIHTHTHTFMMIDMPVQKQKRVVHNEINVENIPPTI